MEVKINREIRNYTEAMFFWTVTAAVHFFCLRLRGGGGHLFFAQALCRHGNRIVDVHFGSRTLCGSWLH